MCVHSCHDKTNIHNFMKRSNEKNDLVTFFCFRKRNLLIRRKRRQKEGKPPYRVGIAHYKIKGHHKFTPLCDPMCNTIHWPMNYTYECSSPRCWRATRGILSSSPQIILKQSRDNPFLNFFLDFQIPNDLSLPILFCPTT